MWNSTLVLTLDLLNLELLSAPKRKQTKIRLRLCLGEWAQRGIWGSWEDAIPGQIMLLHPHIDFSPSSLAATWMYRVLKLFERVGWADRAVPVKTRARDPSSVCPSHAPYFKFFLNQHRNKFHPTSITLQKMDLIQSDTIVMKTKACFSHSNGGCASSDQENVSILMTF